MSAQLATSPAPAVFPATLFTPTPKAAKRVLEFFHRADQPRPHAQGVSERHAPFCPVVRRARNRPARRARNEGLELFRSGAAWLDCQGKETPIQVERNEIAHVATGEACHRRSLPPEKLATGEACHRRSLPRICRPNNARRLPARLRTALVERSKAGLKPLLVDSRSDLPTPFSSAGAT